VTNPQAPANDRSWPVSALGGLSLYDPKRTFGAYRSVPWTDGYIVN